VACAAGPDVSESGLVLALDAGNSKGFDANENLLTYSKDFSAGWSSSLTVTLNNATAPDGTLTAAKIQRPINSGNSSILNHPALSTNTNYCYSAFIKLASTPDATYSICSLSSTSNLISPAYASISYNFVTGTISSFGSLPTISGVIPYPNGWYRLYMVINTSSQTNASLEIRPSSNNLVSDFYIWGAQLERGSSPSPYYPTTGTAKTRGSIWTDLSGNGNTGTLTNGPTYSSANGGSLSFDGVDDYISTPTLSTQFLTTGLTVSIFLYYIPTSANDNVISWGGSAFNTTANSWEIRLRGNAGNVEFSPGRGPGGTGIPLRLQYVSPSGWGNRIMCIDVTYVADGLATMYENGVSRSTRDYTGVGTSTQTNLIRVGCGNDTYFPGYIYSVKVYNRALTASEIQQNYNALRGRYGI